jgi:hydrogenase maturation protease
MSDKTPLIVLGLGNVLLEDDGVGAAAVALLRDRYVAPPGVLVLDGGTLGLALLPYIESADNLVLVDAIRTNEPAGSLVRLHGDDVGPAVATRLSPHQVGVADLLDAARWLDRYPERLTLLGLVPDSMELVVGLSSRVRSSLPMLVNSVVDEARALGFVFRRRNGDEMPAVRSVDVARLSGVY